LVYIKKRNVNLHEFSKIKVMIISYILLMDCFQNMSFPLLKFINEGDFLLHHSFYGPLILLIPISIHLFQIYVLINSLFYFYFLYNTSLLALIFQ